MTHGFLTIFPLFITSVHLYFKTLFMHTLLIAENTHQAEFIQHGLRYENLASEVIHPDRDPLSLPDAVYRADGLFILTANIPQIEKTIDFVKGLKEQIPVIALVPEFDIKLIELMKIQKLKHFFTRPYPFRIMASEMRSFIFKEKEKMEHSVLKVRNLELNRETREVQCNGLSIYLRNKEFALLEFLMMNPGRVLSRETILESVWDRNANIFTNTIDVHINKLRKKIDYSVSEKFIHTVPCSGYIFS